METPQRIKRKIACTADDWFALANAVDKAKKGETVKVNRGALDRLMGDHSLFIQYHRNELEGAV